MCFFHSQWQQSHCKAHERLQASGRRRHETAAVGLQQGMRVIISFSVTKESPGAICMIFDGHKRVLLIRERACVGSTPLMGLYELPTENCVCMHAQFHRCKGCVVQTTALPSSQQNHHNVTFHVRMHMFNEHVKRQCVLRLSAGPKPMNLRESYTRSTCLCSPEFYTNAIANTESFLRFEQ
jgi:hypothetical protein